MSFKTWLSPKFLFEQLRLIDQDTTENREAFNRTQSQEYAQVWLIIAVTCLCLLLVHYGKYSDNLKEIIVWLDSAFSAQGQWVREYRTSQYRELYGYLWWGSIHFIGFIFLPMIIIRFFIKEPLSQYGWQWGEVHHHWRGYLLLALPIMLFAIIASFGDDFSRHYPFYNQAGRSWADLLMWELIYVSQFIAVEFFFRGFLVNGLRRQFGSLSIAVMCLPYLMLHFPKLWPESFGAILFGFFLGVLALMSRSIWGGVAVHVTIALTMDVAALIQTDGLPDRW